MLIELVSAHLHVSQFGQLGSRARVSNLRPRKTPFDLCGGGSRAVHLHFNSSGTGWKIAPQMAGQSRRLIITHEAHFQK
jgi:hypothetical protein